MTSAGSADAAAAPAASCLEPAHLPQILRDYETPQSAPAASFPARRRTDETAANRSTSTSIASEDTLSVGGLINEYRLVAWRGRGFRHAHGDDRDHARPGRTGRGRGPRAGRARRAPDHQPGSLALGFSPSAWSSRPGPRGAPRPPPHLIARWASPRKAPPHRASHRRRAADEDRSGGRAAVIAAFAARGSALTCPQSSTCRRGSPSGRRRGRGRPGAG